MKLLLCLILIITLISSVKSMKIKETDCVQQISSLNGYHTSFKAVSFNGVFQNGNQQTQSSFYEEGYISLDFINKEMMVEFQINLDNQQQINGQTFIFAQNKTQYVVSNDECYLFDFVGEFPSSIGLNKVGDSSIGSIDVEVLEPQTQTSGVSQQIYVDSKLCSPLSLEITNSPNQTPGYTILNFFNFESSTLPSDFVLPSLCSSPTSLPSLHFNSANSVKPTYPKFIKHLLF